MAEAIQILSGNNISVNIEYPDPYRSDNVFIMGLHKAGSVLLNKCIDQICDYNSVYPIAIEARIADKGSIPSDFSPEVLSSLDKNGYIYSSFRTALVVENMKSYRNSKKILLVRDLRDTAVSLYFSFIYSHVDPEHGRSESLETNRRELSTRTINDSILDGIADYTLIHAQEICNHVQLLDNFIIYKYEDIIFNKRQWIEELSFHLGMNVPGWKLDEITNSVDIFPEKENIHSHIRQVIPGNYKKYLSREAVEYIQNKYAQFFDQFGYARDEQ